MTWITNWLKLHFILSIASQLGMWLCVVLVYCLIVWAVLRGSNLSFGDLGAEAGLINTIILGLLLSFRNRAAYDRWWEGRRLWGQLINDSRSLACKLTAYLPHQTLTGSPIVQLLVAFPIALKRHLRDERVRLQDLPGFEKETDEPTHVPLHVAKRLHHVVADWHRQGLLHEIQLRNLDAHLNALMDVCGACERIANTPLPFSYKAMLRTGLFLHFLVAPWYTISTLGFKGVPVLLIASFFLLGVELIDSHIEDPFGHDEDDLDLERFAATIEGNIRAVTPQEGT